MNRAFDRTDEELKKFNSQACALEEFPHTAKYISDLWKIKTIREEHFNTELLEMAQIIDSELSKSQVNPRANDEHLREIYYLSSFASKINISIRTSAVYECKRSRHSEVHSWLRIGAVA